MSELHLRRKLTVRAHGRTLVLVKRPLEKLEHRLMMALTWALYLPQYPELRVDVPVGERYRPDLVQLDAGGRPVFWGECGEVGLEKLRHLCSRHRHAHLVFTKWASDLGPAAALIDSALAGVRRTQPVELLRFDADAARFFGPDGEITIGPADVERRTWPG
ncbi:MAG: hypothetical protein DIU80_007735 [Chloroflexota bacterium]|nr:MAG: hypothetical protein DIU80_04575 [Chloroflexota bacterium]